MKKEHTPTHKAAADVWRKELRKYASPFIASEKKKKVKKSTGKSMLRKSSKPKASPINVIKSAVSILVKEEDTCLSM